MPLRRAWRDRWQAVAAAGLAVVVAALYLVVIWRQDDEDITSGRVLFVAGCLGAAALALVLGTQSGPRARAGLFAAATALLVAWTLLGALSIGLLIAPAAALAGLATAGVVAGGRPEAAAGALAALVLVVAGLALT